MISEVECEWQPKSGPRFQIITEMAGLFREYYFGIGWDS